MLDQDNNFNYRMDIAINIQSCKTIPDNIIPHKIYNTAPRYNTVEQEIDNIYGTQHTGL